MILLASDPTVTSQDRDLKSIKVDVITLNYDETVTDEVIDPKIKGMLSDIAIFKGSNEKTTRFAAVYRA